MVGLIPKLQRFPYNGLLDCQFRIDHSDYRACLVEILQLLHAILRYLKVLALRLGQRLVGSGPIF